MGLHGVMVMQLVPGAPAALQARDHYSMLC